MKTTIDIDKNLLEKAKIVSNSKTNKETVNKALKLLVALYSSETIGITKSRNNKSENGSDNITAFNN